MSQIPRLQRSLGHIDPSRTVFSNVTPTHRKSYYVSRVLRGEHWAAASTSTSTKARHRTVSQKPIRKALSDYRPCNSIGRSASTNVGGDTRHGRSSKACSITFENLKFRWRLSGVSVFDPSFESRQIAIRINIIRRHRLYESVSGLRE